MRIRDIRTQHGTLPSIGSYGADRVQEFMVAERDAAIVLAPLEMRLGPLVERRHAGLFFHAS
jgi:hypothetical protein